MSKYALEINLTPKQKLPLTFLGAFLTSKLKQYWTLAARIYFFVLKKMLFIW